jgi:hypothetical protein
VLTIIIHAFILTQIGVRAACLRAAARDVVSLVTTAPQFIVHEAEVDDGAPINSLGCNESRCWITPIPRIRVAVLGVINGPSVAVHFRSVTVPLIGTILGDALVESVVMHPLVAAVLRTRPVRQVATA